MILRKLFKGALIHWKKCNEVVFIPLKKRNGRLECICNFCLMGSFEGLPLLCVRICYSAIPMGWFEPNPLEILYFVYSSH